MTICIFVKSRSIFTNIIYAGTVHVYAIAMLMSNHTNIMYNK